MNRWGNFSSIFFPALPPACHGLPSLCNLSVSTSFCKADSIKITPVAVRESDRVQFDFADWLCAFCFFSSSYCFACNSYQEGRKQASALSSSAGKRPLRRTHLMSWDIDITHRGMIDYGLTHTFSSLPQYISDEEMGHIAVLSMHSAGVWLCTCYTWIALARCPFTHFTNKIVMSSVFSKTSLFCCVQPCQDSVAESTRKGI